MHKLRALLILLVSALAGLTFAVVRSTNAEATSGPITPRLGYWIEGHTDYVGIYGGYVNGVWRRMLCTTPPAAVPSHVSFHSTTDFDGRGAVLTATLDALVRRYLPIVHTDFGGAAISQAALMILGDSADVSRRARSLPRSTDVMAYARSMVTFARAHRGGYVMSLRFGTATVPGQAGRGTVSLHAAGGAPVTGAVTLAHSSNISLPGSVTLSSTGTASFGYRSLGWGTATASAHKSGLNSPALFASTPTPGVQHMITAAPSVSASASASFRAPVGGVGHSYGCTSQCNGAPLVQLSACTTPSAYRSAVDFHYAGHTATLYFAPSSLRTCHRIVRRMVDGTVVTASRRYQRPDGSWTLNEPAPGRFVVDCPAPPRIGALIAYNCNRGSVTFAIGTSNGLTLSPTVNRTGHRWKLEIIGSARATVYASPGQQAVKKVGFTCGRPTSYTFRAAVQKASGYYNYGHAATVTTP